MREPTLAVVTALSPSSTTLAEYGWHLLTALGRIPGVNVVALVEDDRNLEYPAIPGVRVVPAWRFDSLVNPIRLGRAARRAGADVVIFNAHFTSFGSGKLASTLGLLAPAVMRLVGARSITLLHNIVEAVDLAAAGFGSRRLVQRLLRIAGTAVTWLALRATDLVTTTMPEYVEILRAKYRCDAVALTPHGTFASPTEPVAPKEPGRVLAFGKFGTYKRLEPLIEAMRLLDRPGLHLVVAGTDSPNTPGYLADVEKRLGGDDVRFAGYVAEADVEAMFRDAALSVFPYTATTGSSGVLHQAGGFGCAPVLPRIGDLEGLVRAEGYTGSFFLPDDVGDLARAIAEVLDDEERRAAIAQHNYVAARGLGIDDVAEWYVLHASRLATSRPTAWMEAAA